ncbi:Oleate hydratase [Mycena venus]|uniref:Oleate hydratase n=1 Tax=Mycena venus TaxID=2733690 RepID=A0A8H7D7Y2_9AGAR|nr:Oleate hydratase [Mycena venus]
MSSNYYQPGRPSLILPSSIPTPALASYRPSDTSSPQHIPNGWGPFFHEDLSPTSVFTQLMDSIFTYLDAGRTGYLTPEAYSRFLTDQGYAKKENIWKANLDCLADWVGETKEKPADAALKRHFDLFSIEYVLRKRASSLERDLRSLGLATPICTSESSSTSGGAMPLLTRKGFIDVTAIETLCDPSRHWGNISRIRKLYDLPAVHGWGDLPRSVLPSMPDQRMVKHVAAIRGVCEGAGTCQKQGGGGRGQECVGYT